MKLYCYLLLLLLCSNELSAHLYQSENPPAIRVAVYNSGLLYSDNKGIEVDILNDLARRTGSRFMVSVETKEQAFTDFKNSDIDFVFAHNCYQTKSSWFLSCFKLQNYAIIHVKPGKNTKSRNQYCAQLNFKFGIVKTDSYGLGNDSIISQLRKKKKVVESSSHDLLIQNFKSNNVQAMFAPSTEFRSLFKDLISNRSIIIQNWAPVDTTESFGILLSKSRFSEAEAQHWRKEIIEMIFDGTIEKILLKYLPEDDVKHMISY